MHGITAKHTVNMKRTTFPAGRLRQVCVNRSAIAENLTCNSDKYPTIIVVEDGKLHEFHAVEANGLVQFDDTRDIPAKVFLETDQTIEAFIDPKGEPTFLYRPKPPGILLRIGRKIPIVGCFLSEETPTGSD
jgi:hypothetical protein